jgi:hypothetical protein
LARVSLATVALTVICFAGIAYPADSDWFNPTRVTLRSGVLLHADYSLVTFTNSANGDVRIEVASAFAGKSEKGEMIVVGGKILLAKDLEFSPGAEIDTLDGPTLEVQLLLKLLSKAVPGGPSQARLSQVVALKQQNEPIEVSTRSASGTYPVPWSLNGSLKREGSNRLAFTLTFTFLQAPGPISFAGTWEKASVAPVLPDSMSVVGWRAFKIGPYSKQDSHGTIFDYGAQELSTKFKTLGEARAAAKTGA